MEKCHTHSASYTGDRHRYTNRDRDNETPDIVKRSKVKNMEQKCTWRKMITTRKINTTRKTEKISKGIVTKVERETH